ncbi:MAG: GNAT family N-acetyltransferase [Saonia sp.]
MITETKRLLIEQANLADSLFFLKLMNSTNWIEFIGDRGITSEEKASEYIRKSLLDSYTRHGYGLFKISFKETALPIGICGFIKRDYLNHADIGFAILPEYEGKGYAYEAMQATMTYGRNILKLHPILGITTHKNSKSQHLLSKIGLRLIKPIKSPENEKEFLLFSNA